MKLSASVPAELASDEFMAKLKKMGCDPIITSQVVRVVYEGTRLKFGQKLIKLFESQPHHDITVFYDNGEKPERR